MLYLLCVSCIIFLNMNSAVYARYPITQHSNTYPKQGRLRVIVTTHHRMIAPSKGAFFKYRLLGCPHASHQGELFRGKTYSSMLTSTHTRKLRTTLMDRGTWVGYERNDKSKGILLSCSWYGNGFLTRTLSSVFTNALATRLLIIPLTIAKSMMRSATALCERNTCQNQGHSAAICPT